MSQINSLLQKAGESKVPGISGYRSLNNFTAIANPNIALAMYGQ